MDEVVVLLWRFLVITRTAWKEHGGQAVISKRKG
jgi:hypothetical protein